MYFSPELLQIMFVKNQKISTQMAIDKTIEIES